MTQRYSFRCEHKNTFPQLPSRLILLPLIRKGVGIKSSGKFAKGTPKIREEEQLDNQQYLVN